MTTRLKKVISVTLADRDVLKIDALAASLRMNRSETVREIIRSKRTPKLLPNGRRTLLEDSQ
jgi:hypothetical protein